jgi:hypothetical protein
MSCTDNNRIEVEHLALQDINGYEITAIFATYEHVTRDASFDYAGTHCTGGRSGTHKCEEQSIEDVEIHGYEYEWPKGSEGEYFLIRKRGDIPRSRLVEYEEIVQDILERNLW